METLPLIRVRIRRPGGALWRTGHLTPYLAETIRSDVRRSPCRIEVFVAGDADTVALVRRRLGLRIRIVTRPRGSSGAAA